MHDDAVEPGTRTTPRSCQQWVRARLEENVPYDQFVERILTATSREGRSLDEWGKDVFAINDGYQTPRTDATLYSERKTLDLYWQRRRCRRRAGRLQSRAWFLGLAARDTPSVTAIRTMFGSRTIS